MEYLSIILDGILILVFASFIITGRKKGFIKTVLSLIVTVVSILIAREYSPAVAKWVNDTFIHEMGVKWLTNLISDNISSGAQAIAGMIPKAISEAVVTFTDTSVEALLSGVATDAQIAAVAEKIYIAAENAFILSVISAIVFLVIFAISNAIFSIGVSLVNIIAKLPVLKSLNKLLGGLLGAIKGAIGISVICSLLVTVTRLFAGSPLQTAVDGSKITQLVLSLISSL